MSPKKLTPAEFRTEDEEEAELVAFLSNRISFYDTKYEIYKLADPEEVQTKIKKLYDEDRYVEAEELIDAIDRGTSKNTEEMIKKSKSKSYRLSKVQFVKAVKKAYEENAAVADILRSNISRKIESNLNKLNNNSEIDQEKLTQLEEIVKKWDNKEGRSPLKEGYKLGHHLLGKSSIEKYDIFARGFVRKKILEEKINDEKLIDIYSKYYRIPDPDDIFYNANITLNENEGNLNLIFDYELNYIIDCYNREKLDDFLSDIANQDYSKEELKDLPIFDKFYKLPEIVESIKEGRDKEIEPHHITDRPEWDEIIEEISFPRLKLKFPLEIKGDSLKLGGSSLERNSVEKTVLGKILKNLDSDIRSFDIEKAKQKAIKAVEEGDFSSAKKIHKQISIYDASKYMASNVEDMILDGLSSQVVSLTMPRGVSGLLKIFDLKKEDILW